MIFSKNQDFKNLQMEKNIKFKSQKKKNLLIFGTGNFAETVYSYFTRYTDYNISGFISDSKKNKKSFLGLNVLTIKDFYKKKKPNNNHVFVAIGYDQMNSTREKYYKILKKKGYHLASFVHPNVVTWGDQSIGQNCFVFENNVIQKGVTLKNNIIIWSGNHVGHDSTIMDNTWITSQAVIYSNVIVGKNCFIGSNANIKDGIVLGDFNFVGAGTNIWNNSLSFSFFPPKKNDGIVLKKTHMMKLI